MTNKFLRVVTETPILNTPNFQQVFGGLNNNKLQTDEKGHIRALEFIALKLMVFKIIKHTSYPYIYEVEHERYKKKPLFIDCRFTKQITYHLPKPIVLNLKKHEIFKKLFSLLGAEYLWGGNWGRGVEKMLKYYSPITSYNLNKWMLKGVDCSGLLFEATNGYTPRNTQELLNYKNPVFIENLSCSEIAKIVQPLDLIVYRGHVFIVIDNQFTIESRENFGVIKTSLNKRLEELLKTHKPVNKIKSIDEFVIRRWYNV